MTKRGTRAGSAGAMGRTGLAGLAGLALAGAVLAGAPPAARAADDKPSETTAVDEILGILKKRGDIDEEEYQRLVAKNAKHVEKKDKSWFDRITLFGDVRGRYEGFWYDGDPLGNSLPDRHRARYRARLGVNAEINDYVNAVVRLATGENDSRSNNQTLGSGVDFGPDATWFDWGYLNLHTKAGQLPIEGGTAAVQFGKMPNPFLQKVGQDLLWDPDITPEGIAFLVSGRPVDGLRLYLASGYYIINENSGVTGSASDPYLLGTQLGGELTPLEGLELGTHLSWYDFNALNAAFIQRGVRGVKPGTTPPAGAVAGATDAAGNIIDGLTGDPNGGSLQVGEVGAYLTWKGIEAWPITFYGGVSKNWSARISHVFQNVGADDVAWNAGAEIGDKTKWLKLGVAFFHVESNAFPAQFIDSDILDGITNREAWLFTASRQIFKNTDLNFWLSSSDKIAEELPGMSPSLANVKRVRVRADVEVKF